MNPEVVKLPAPELDTDRELLSADEFDLKGFFVTEASRENSELDQSTATHQLADEPDLLIELKSEATEAVAVLSSKITQESFKAGVSLSSGVLSALGSLVGACGPFCMHGLGSLASVGTTSTSGFSLMGGAGLSSISRDTKGNLNLGLESAALARATGISQEQLLSGRYSAADILSLFLDVFGTGIQTCVFGILDVFMDALIPTASTA